MIQMEKMEIRMYSAMVEFAFGSSKRIVFGDEGQPGLEIGRDKRSRKVVAFMCFYTFLVCITEFFKVSKTSPFPADFPSSPSTKVTK